MARIRCYTTLNALLTSAETPSHASRVNVEQDRYSSTPPRGRAEPRDADTERVRCVVRSIVGLSGEDEEFFSS